MTRVSLTGSVGDSDHALLSADSSAHPGVATAGGRDRHHVLPHPETRSSR